MGERKIIQVEDKVPFNLLVPLSIQHMFAMFGASVLVPFVFGINPALVLFMNGVGTLIFMTVTKGKAPAYLGSSFRILWMCIIVYYLQMWNRMGRCCASAGSDGTGSSIDRTGTFKLCGQQCRTSG